MARSLSPWPSWLPLATAPAPAATSTSTLRPPPTRRYYRLRQVDLDGTVAYSPVVALSRSVATAAALEAYPNPFADKLTVALPGRFEAQAASVQLFTLAGRPVYGTTLALSAAPQALPELPECPLACMCCA